MTDFCVLALTIMVCLLMLVIIGDAFGIPKIFERIAVALERNNEQKQKMNLVTFITTFVRPNTIIRLWIEAVEGHRLLVDHSGKETGMEWEIIDGSGWQAVFRNWEVIGVTDILCESYPEAVNIVIQRGEQE